MYTIERIGKLLRQARKRFRQLGIKIRSKHDDGSTGWTEHAPYNAILVTAAAPTLIDTLIEQLAIGGRLVAPVGTASEQALVQLTRTIDGSITHEILEPVTFVSCYQGCWIKSTLRTPLMKIFGPLYNRAITWSRHRYAPALLTGLSFVEGFIFPVPPEVMLAPMSLANRHQALWFATLSSTPAHSLAHYWVTYSATSHLQQCNH